MFARIFSLPTFFRFTLPSLIISMSKRCLISIYLRQEKWRVGPPSTHSIIPSLSWKLTVDPCDICSSVNTCRIHAIILHASKRSMYSVSDELRVTSFCVLLDIDVGAFPICTNILVQLFRLKLSSPPQFASACALNWPSIPGFKTRAKFLVPLRYINTIFAATK